MMRIEEIKKRWQVVAASGRLVEGAAWTDFVSNAIADIAYLLDCHDKWDKESLRQIVDERNELRAELARLQALVPRCICGEEAQGG
jgi:hypothetical protein